MKQAPSNNNRLHNNPIFTIHSYTRCFFPMCVQGYNSYNIAAPTIVLTCRSVKV